MKCKVYIYINNFSKRKKGKNRTDPECPLQHQPQKGQKGTDPKLPSTPQKGQKWNRPQMFPATRKKCQKWCFFFEKICRKTLKKIVCYDINYIGKIDKSFETKNGGKTC